MKGIFDRLLAPPAVAYDAKGDWNAQGAVRAF